jgi:hypothetical protein
VEAGYAEDSEMHRNAWRGAAATALITVVGLVSAGGATSTVPRGATYKGKTEQGFSITIKTASTGSKIRVFATRARTSLCLQNGSPSEPQIVNILPPVPIRVKASGRFAIDKPNNNEDYSPNYRVKGRVTEKRVTGTFAWRRYKSFSNESCVTREIEFTARRKR